MLQLALPADRSLGVSGPALLEARRGGPRGGLVRELGRSRLLKLGRSWLRELGRSVPLELGRSLLLELGRSLLL